MSGSVLCASLSIKHVEIDGCGEGRGLSFAPGFARWPVSTQDKLYCDRKVQKIIKPVKKQNSTGTEAEFQSQFPRSNFIITEHQT